MLFPQNKALVHSKTEKIIMTNQSLALQDLTRHRSGTYTCAASNDEGEGVSEGVFLPVKCESNLPPVREGVLPVKFESNRPSVKEGVLPVKCESNHPPSERVSFPSNVSKTSHQSAGTSLPSNAIRISLSLRGHLPPRYILVKPSLFHVLG